MLIGWHDKHADGLLVSVGRLSAHVGEINSFAIYPSSQRSSPHPSYCVFYAWLLMPCLKLLGDLGPVAFSFLTFMPTVITYLLHDFLFSLGLAHRGSKLQEGRC